MQAVLSILIFVVLAIAALVAIFIALGLYAGFRDGWPSGPIDDFPSFKERRHERRRRDGRAVPPPREIVL